MDEKRGVVSNGSEAFPACRDGAGVYFQASKASKACHSAEGCGALRLVRFEGDVPGR